MRVMGNLKNFGLLFFTIVLLSSCSVSDMLPKSDQFHKHLYGDYIELDLSRSSELNDVEGELIAVDDSNIYIIEVWREEQNYFEVNKSEVEDFRVYHFNPSYPSLSNGILSLIPLSHGFFMVLTLPINLITMGVIHGHLKDRASSSSKEIELSDIYQYARYPGGLPTNIEFHEIKPMPVKD